MNDQGTTPDRIAMSVAPITTPAPTPLGATEHIESILQLLDVKESTRKVYRYGLRDFIAWNTSQSLNAHTITSYKANLRARTDLSASTKNLYLSAVRALLTQLHRVGVIDRDLGKGIKGFGVTRAHKRAPITDEQVTRVFDYLREKKDKRLILIFTLLFFQGLRQHEVISIRVEDLNVSARTLMIEGKSRDDREPIDLHPRTIEVLQWFLEESRLKSGYLFYSTRNETGHISRIQLGRMIRAVHEACEVKNTGHAWRKVFTSKLIEAGLDLLTVSSFTRHKSVTMLQVYYDRLDKSKKLPVYYDTFDENPI